MKRAYPPHFIACRVLFGTVKIKNAHVHLIEKERMG